MAAKNNPLSEIVESSTAELAALLATGVEFGQKSAEVHVLKGLDGQEDGIPFVVVGGQVQSLKGYMPPRLGRMAPAFGDATSFIAYIKRFSTENTLVFATFDKRGGTFTVVIDYPAKGGVSRKEHIATFSVSPTDVWKDWLSINGQPQKQESFCEFIDKYRKIFVTPDGTTMLELARYIEGKKEGKFTFGQRLQTGDRQVVWQEDTALAAGARGGELTPIPEQVVIKLALFEGTEPVEVTAWLRVYVNAGAITFKFDTQYLDYVVREALNNLRTEIRDETNLTVLLGSHGGPAPQAIEL